MHAQHACRLLSLSDACKREILAAGGVTALAPLLSTSNEAARSNARQARNPWWNIRKVAGSCLMRASFLQDATLVSY